MRLGISKEVQKEPNKDKFDIESYKELDSTTLYNKIVEIYNGLTNELISDNENQKLMVLNYNTLLQQKTLPESEKQSQLEALQKQIHTLKADIQTKKQFYLKLLELQESQKLEKQKLQRQFSGFDK